MTRLRTALLGALLWCGVVAVVATLVWVVISRAGQGVVPQAQPRAEVTGSVPVPGDERPAVRVSPGVTLAPRPSRSTTGPSSGTTPPAPPSSTTALPGPQRRSWDDTPGHIIAECRGPSADLVSAFPNAGWRYAIGSDGPALVQVRFTRIGEDHPVTVTARCVTGVPSFSAVRSEGGDDD
jgi:hypothetical protein